MPNRWRSTLIGASRDLRTKAGHPTSVTNIDITEFLVKTKQIFWNARTILKINLTYLDWFRDFMSWLLNPLFQWHVCPVQSRLSDRPNLNALGRYLLNQLGKQFSENWSENLRFGPSYIRVARVRCSHPMRCSSWSQNLELFVSSSLGLKKLKGLNDARNISIDTKSRNKSSF